MPFNLIRNIPGNFILKHLSGPSGGKERTIILFDSYISSNEEKLLENFLKISGEVFLVTREKSGDTQLEPDSVREVVSLCENNCNLVVSGKFAPIIIREYRKFQQAGKVIFINPSYEPDTAYMMSSFETPSLVITGTPGNLDHDPEAVKYHDLISGSKIQYVRGVTGNPLFMKFTQSFNSILRFLSDE